MPSILRHLCITLAAVVALAPAAAQQPEPPQSISPAARAAWAFDRSDLSPHPEVRFGVLANGMRYALMRSPRPAGALSVRLRFDAGAAVEGEREQGALHLIEHLVFHGTPAIPEGALPLMLASRGLKRWSDFNAFTSYDETLYSLDLARSDFAARETALMLMREIAGNLLFTGPVIAGAKAKVRDEIAARDAVGDAILSAQHAFWMPGTGIDRGPVAGSRREVDRVTPTALRRLYALHYRPERAILVMVGDFDLDDAERDVAARFSDWTGRGAPARFAQAAIAPARGIEARLFAGQDAPTSVTIATVSPLGGATDAGAPRDLAFLQHLGTLMLNRRLAGLAAGEGAPFAAADLAVYDHFSTARLARIEIAARDRDWRRALQAGASALADALATGFSQAELDAQLAASRVSLAAASAPRTASQIADALTEAAGRGIVFTAPADAAATADYLSRIRLDDVNAAFRSVWARPERLLFVSHNRQITDAEASIASAWHAAASPEL